MAFSCQPVIFQVSCDFLLYEVAIFLPLSDLTLWFSLNCTESCLHFTRLSSKLSYHCKYISIPHSFNLNNVTSLCKNKGKRKEKSKYVIQTTEGWEEKRGQLVLQCLFGFPPVVIHNKSTHPATNWWSAYLFCFLCKTSKGRWNAQIFKPFFLLAETSSEKI